MQLSTVFVAFSALVIPGAFAGQIDFFSDTRCQNYIGSSFVGTHQITGGPAGSFSALWKHADQTSCSRTCGPLNICGDSSCNRRTQVGLGGCATFNTGVWARNGCGFNFCNA